MVTVDYAAMHGADLRSMAADYTSTADVRAALAFAAEDVVNTQAAAQHALSTAKSAAAVAEAAQMSHGNSAINLVRVAAIAYVRGDLTLKGMEAYVQQAPLAPSSVAEVLMLSAVVPGATKVWLDMTAEVALAAKVDLTTPAAPLFGGPNLPTVVRDFFGAQGIRVALDYPRSSRIWCRVVNVATGENIGAVQQYQGDEGAYTIGEVLP